VKRRVYIVGCGAAKLDHPARARELYTGSLFVAARRFVEARRARWRILSARYGLVHPDSVLPPYNQRLWRRKDERAAWALTAASGLRYENACTELHVVFLCGADYADPVATLLESWGVTTEQPLAGLGLGERLHWFKARDRRQAE
jgi:hypothetical protein